MQGKRKRLILFIAFLLTCLILVISFFNKKGEEERVQLLPKPVLSEQQDFANPALVYQPLTHNLSVDPVEKKCPMYQEFRRLNFLHPDVRRKLCSNAEAYRLYTDGFQMCVLTHPFDADMLSVAASGSDVVKLSGLNHVQLPIYVYKGTDMISNAIRRTGSWEGPQAIRTLRVASSIPDVTFVDIGSNIGFYSLQAAKLGMPVVSVDANIRNLLRLELSLKASSLRASLVWNFIAPDQKLRYLTFHDSCNVGGAATYMQHLTDTVPVMPTRSEKICDIIRTKNVVMKMDIEGGETDFLMSSGRLFTDFSVAAVQMEWVPPYVHDSNGAKIKHFFTTRNYTAWLLPGMQELRVADAAKWGSIYRDVLWIRKDFLKLMQSKRLLSNK